MVFDHFPRRWGKKDEDEFRTFLFLICVRARPTPRGLGRASQSSPQSSLKEMDDFSGMNGI